MTAPALLLLDPTGRGGALRRLAARVGEARPDLACAGATDPDEAGRMGAALAARGAVEIVCLPLRAAGLFHAHRRLAEASRDAAQRGAGPDVPVTLAAPLGATGPLFTVADEHLREAIARSGTRALDALVLYHDSLDDVAGMELLERRARTWALHHRLPYAVATAEDPAALPAAVAGHVSRGRRHIAIANLAWGRPVPPETSRLPGVIAIGVPPVAEPAVVEAVLGAYAPAALSTLAADVAC